MKPYFIALLIGAIAMLSDFVGRGGGSARKRSR
jgi:hypothetical protein